ncbi:MAG: hypothetical protein WCI04_02140 [archaeon]
MFVNFPNGNSKGRLSAEEIMVRYCLSLEELLKEIDLLKSCENQGSVGGGG